MPNTELDYRKLVRMILAILTALLVLAASRHGVRAATGHSFVLSAADPYGVHDCVRQVPEGSQVVASTWREAHGHRGD